MRYEKTALYYFLCWLCFEVKLWIAFVRIVTIRVRRKFRRLRTKYDRANSNSFGKNECLNVNSKIENINDFIFFYHFVYRNNLIKASTICLNFLFPQFSLNNNWRESRPLLDKISVGGGVYNFFLFYKFNFYFYLFSFS